MHTAINKILAISIVILTSIGLLISLFLLIQTWRLRKPVTQNLQSVARETSIILITSSSGLNIIDGVVINVYSSTVSLSASTSVLSSTLKDSSEFIGNAGSFMGEEVINTITNTQAAINSAQASASAVDNILTTLSKIPLIGINYNPSQPLSAALGDVSASLDPLQKNLKDFETNLKTTQSDMDAFRSQLYILDQNINTINSNLKSAQGVIDNYRTQLTSLQTSTNRAITSLPRWITTVCWILTFFILWFMLFLSAIMLQAISMITNKNGWIRPPVRDDLPPI